MTIWIKACFRPCENQCLGWSISSSWSSFSSQVIKYNRGRTNNKILSQSLGDEKVENMSGIGHLCWFQGVIQRRLQFPQLILSSFFTWERSVSKDVDLGFFFKITFLLKHCLFFKPTMALTCQCNSVASSQVK